MKRKFLTILIALAAALCLCLGITACDSGNAGGGDTNITDPSDGQSPENNTPHVHSFADYVYNNDATCTGDGTETGTCSCGAMDTRTKKGSALGHSFDIPCEAVEATCSEAGHPAGMECSRCHVLNIPVEEYTPALHVQYMLWEGGYAVLCLSRDDITGLPRGCTDKEITIPRTYMGKLVNSIGDYAFMDCSSLESIVIPNSVTEIGESAFYRCDSLESIVIPDSVTSIGRYAFDDTAYYNDQSHWDSSSVLYIGNHLIEAKDTSSHYIIRSNTKTIAGGAFRDCSSLESVTFEDESSLASIGAYAFQSCRLLSSIEIPESVTSIGSFAFAGCWQLTSIVIPDSVRSIGDNVLNNTEYYSNQNHWDPSGVLYVGNHLIKAENTLSSHYIIRNNTKTIAGGAFRDCSSLTGITIPDGVVAIGNAVFSGCSSLISITVAQGNPVYHSNGNCLIETESKTLIAGCKTSKIPSNGSVTSIGGSAFSGYSLLTSIVIPDNVTSIGESAFEYCSSLESVVFESESSLTSIGLYAFKNCSALERIVIPDSVTSIGGWVFEYCSSLESIVIPDSVTSIGMDAFCGCSSLESIVIPDSVTSIGGYAFWGCSSLEKVFYMGTADEWNEIENSNSSLTRATRYYYSAEENYDGQHWHYDDETGEPVVWSKENA